MIAYILFVLGFVLLIKGADFLVEGTSYIARRFGVSDLVIGLTIVSFGSSAPELLVNIVASANDKTELAIGNVLGSNITNILLALGISAAIHPLHLQKSTVWKEIPFSLLAVIVLAFVANDTLIYGSSYSLISRGDGLVFIALFALFLYYIYGLENHDLDEDKGSRQLGMIKASAMTMGGLVGISLGGQWVVDGATAIARTLEISEAMIGLTVVAIGTSLPEIVTSAVAAYKKRVDIAIGNVVGSNIFNIFWVLGISAVIRPIGFRPALNADVAMVGFATTVLFFSLFLGRRHTIDRKEGISFVVIYISYLVYLIHRG